MLDRQRAGVAKAKARVATKAVCADSSAARAVEIRVNKRSVGATESGCVAQVA
jgi:hypothetical protein